MPRHLTREREMRFGPNVVFLPRLTPYFPASVPQYVFSIRAFFAYIRAYSEFRTSCDSQRARLCVCVCCKSRVLVFSVCKPRRRPTVASIHADLSLSFYHRLSLFLSFLLFLLVLSPFSSFDVRLLVSPSVFGVSVLARISMVLSTSETFDFSPPFPARTSARLLSLRPTARSSGRSSSGRPAFSSLFFAPPLLRTLCSSFSAAAAAAGVVFSLSRSRRDQVLRTAKHMTHAFCRSRLRIF